MAFSLSRLNSLCRRSSFLLPLALALLLLSTTSALRSWMRHNALVADEQTSRDILEHEGRLLTALIDAETGQRGFVLTGQEGYLQPFSRGAKAAPVELAALQRAVVSPEQRARAAAIGPLLAAKLNELRLTIRLRRSSGFDAALKTVSTNEGKNAMDRIRTLCEQIQASENSRLIEKTREAQGEEKENIVVTAGSSLLFVLLAVALFTIKRVERQRARLMDDMHQRNEILRRQALLLDMANDTIFIRDGDDRITYWNQGAERLYGWSKEEASRTSRSHLAQYPIPGGPRIDQGQTSLHGPLGGRTATYPPRRYVCDGGQQLDASTRRFQPARFSHRNEF